VAEAPPEYAFEVAFCVARTLGRRVPPRESTTVACCFWLGSNIGQEILTGVCRYARTRENWRILRLDARDAADFLDDSSVVADGLIIQPFSAQPLDWALARRLPTVAVNLSFPRPAVPQICTDDAEVGRAAAEFFLRRGISHFGFCGRSGHPSSDLRRKGFLARLRQEGHPCSEFDQPFEFGGRHFRTDFFAGAAAWIAGLSPRTAIFAFVDAQAATLVDAALAVGRKVPDDLLILGAGSDPVSQDMAAVSLSTIELPNLDVGFRAAKALDALLTRAKPPPSPLLLPPLRIIERRSTDAFAFEDPALRKALAFIAENLHRPLYVSDIARAAGLSRRPLEKRFRRLLSVAPHEEINRLRVGRAKELLTSTNLKLEQIAELCGFGDARHQCAIFKSLTRLTPREYRLRNGPRG
jgi:LacI family transcriptional regulator